MLVQVVIIVNIVNCLLLNLSQAAPTVTVASSSSSSPSAVAEAHTDHKAPAGVETLKFEATRQLPAISNSAVTEKHEHSLEPESTSLSQKVKRDSTVKSESSELDTQETGHYLPSAYPSATESEYGYDAGKNNYGKQASDWSLYDQG